MSDSTDGKDDLFNPNDFLVLFPLWAVGRADQGVEGLLKFPQPDGELAVTLFTDQDLAQTVLDSSPFPGIYVLRPIADPIEFRGLLVGLERAGTVYVAIDPTAANPAGNTYRVTVLLAKIP